MRTKHSFCVVGIALTIVCVSSTVHARNPIRKNFFNAYPSAEGTVLDSVPSHAGHCGVCHYDFSGGGASLFPGVIDIGGERVQRDAATALLPLEAELRIAGPEGERTTPISSFFTSDGIWNRRMQPAELLVSVRVPRPDARTRHSFQKLRARDSIDFPMLNLAVRVDFAEDEAVTGLQMAASGMGSYPRKIGKLEAIAEGSPFTGAVVEEIAQQAFRQCHPLENIPVDAEWRRAMVPVLVRRALAEITA